MAEVSAELVRRRSTRRTTKFSIGSTVKGFEVYYPAALALQGYWLDEVRLRDQMALKRKEYQVGEQRG